MMRGVCFPLRRRSAGPPPLLWPYPYHLFPRIVRPLCRFQRYSCPARPNPARRRHPARASAFPAQPYPCAPPASTAQSYPCLPPVFSCAPPPASPVRLNPARRVALRARPHPLCSPIPACRRFCVPRRPAPAGYCLCPAGRADIGREPARTVPAASPCAPARVIRTALSLRAAGFVRPPREGRILAGIQRPPASPVRPIPAPARVIRTALSLRAAGFARPPREGRILAASQRVPYPPPAASPCARVRIHCAVLSLPAAGSVCRVALRAHPPLGCAHTLPARVSCAAYPCAPRVLPASSFACAPRERRILAASQRVPCPPRHPARRPPPGFVRPRLVRSAARVPCAAYPCAPRVLPAASFCLRSAGKADNGSEPARTVPARVLRAA